MQAKDGAFSLDGKRFRYLGGNNYPLVQDNHTRTELDSFFAQCNANGISVVRTWAFNRHVPATSSVGDFISLHSKELTFNEATFQSLDRVLSRARCAGVKIILVLQDNNGGKKGDWCRWNNVINGTSYNTEVGDDFHTDPAIRLAFQRYINKFLTRVNTCNGIPYRDDDTIFSWELINEGTYTGNHNIIADANAGTLESSRVHVMTDWYATMSADIKTLDRNHLVGTGSISQYADYTRNDPVHNGSYYGLDYKSQHQLGSIDYFDFHLYPYGDRPAFGLRAYGQNALGGTSPVPTRAGLLAQLKQFADDAHAAAKPVTIGEYGVDKQDTLTSDAYVAYPRAANFAHFVSDWFAAGGDGFTMWHFTNLFDDNNYNIFPGAPHTSANANGNANDDDQDLLRALRAIRAGKE